MFSNLFSSHSSSPWFVAGFDSTTGMLKALANSLHDKGFPGVGRLPESETLAKVINALPWKLQRNIYVKGSGKGTVKPQKLGEVRTEDFTNWVTQLYPSRKYPAIMIGSSNGAAVHLAAAMGIPWLPQTFLIPVKTPNLSADDPIKRMEWARPWGEKLLNSNTGLQLHHMMDPSQDRPMLENTSYFRTKLLHLGSAYTQFIEQHLEKAGTILVVDCERKRPVTQVGERHFFQFGGLGGTSIEEYFNGSPQVKEFLQQAGSDHEKWEAPQPTSDQPEAEWGFVTSLQDSIEKLANERKFEVKRIVFNEAEDLSPFVANLYRWWYKKREMPADTLLADMFFLMDPYWTLSAGAVPFWLAFNAEPSVQRITEYLQQTTPYEEIYLMPFSNGVKGIRYASEEKLKTILSYARKKGEFIGAEPDQYPFDFGVFIRYEKELKEKLYTSYPTEEKLSLQQFFSFAEQTQGQYKVAIAAPEATKVGL